MAFAKDFGMNDVALKPKILRAFLRFYVPDGKHPFHNASDLLFVVWSIKTHKLLAEGGPVKQELMDGWKAAVDSWNERLFYLMGCNMPYDCWAGISLLGVTCQECSSERFSASYSLWLDKLLNHVQAASHVVRVAAFAALSDLFTRLNRFPKARKEATSLATKVIEPTLKMLSADGSGAEGALGLLCTLMNFFPASIRQHYDSVEAAIVSKIISGRCSAGVLKKLSYSLSLLPKSRGDDHSWLLMMEKILLSIHNHLNDALQDLEEDFRSREAMEVLLPSGKEPPPPLGGLAVTEQISTLSTWRPERLLGSKICALMSCCCMMLTSYPVKVSVPIRGLVALAQRVLIVDGSRSRTSFSLMTTLNHECMCSELPLLQLHTLEIVAAVIKGLSSQVLPHIADIVLMLTHYLRRCVFPELRVRAYSIMKNLLMSMGVGTAIHLIKDVTSIAFVDLDPSGCKKDESILKGSMEILTKSGRKRKKHSSVTESFQEQPAKDGLEIEMPQNSTEISLKIAALDTLEALLTVGGSLKSENWRPNVDHLVITVAKNACEGGWSQGETNVFASGEPNLVWADFQLASLRVLLASLLHPVRTRPSHLAQGLELFHSGIQGKGTRVADFCVHALRYLVVHGNPRTLPLLSINSSLKDYKGVGHKLVDASYPFGYGQLSTSQVGVQGKDSSEPESEQDDLYENWVENDDDETQQNANDAAKPPATVVGTSVTMVSDEKDLDVSPSSLAEKIVVAENDFTVESPILENSKKQRRDSAPSTSANLLIEAQSVVVTSEHTASDSVGLEAAVKCDIGNGISATDELRASISEQYVFETKNDKLNTTVERMSATLSRSDKIRGLTFESDDESANSIPDIIDGDPDSD